MKKHLRKLLLLMIITVVTFTGCQKTPASNTEGRGENNSEIENTQEESSQHEGEEVQIQKSAILENRIALGDGLLYHVPNARVEQFLQQEIALFDGNLLVWGNGQDQDKAGFWLTLVSLETGEILQEKIFTGMDLPNVQVCGDKIAVIDWGVGQVTLLDCTFEEIGHYNTFSTYCAIYLDEAAEHIYTFTKEGIRVLDIESEKTTYLLEDVMLLLASSKCGNTVTVTYTDANTQLGENAVVDLDAGTIEKIPFEGAVHSVEYNEGIWMAGVTEEDNAYYLGKAERPKKFSVQGENYAAMTLVANPLRLMKSTYDDEGRTTLTLYSLDGKYLSQTKLPERIASVIYEPVWSEADGGYFLIAIDNTGKDMLLFWDMSIPTVGEDITLVSAYEEEETDSEVSKSLLERAEKMEAKYGVEVLIGDQTEESYGIYNMAREMNEAYIAEGLDALEVALKKYPDGFMKQLLYGDQKKLEFHMTGAFSLKEYPEGEVNGFTSYIGLAQEAAGKNVVVVDITMAGSIEQTLHHEIMHIIDNKLRFDANLREGALYSEETWNTYNPEGFAYVEDKFHLPESIYNDGYEGYFIDIYSRTTANEDRARIMEYAMVDADWAFSNAEGRYAKLKFLSDCIRDAFDTKGWPEKTVWEKTLERCR